MNPSPSSITQRAILRMLTVFMPICALGLLRLFPLVFAQFLTAGQLGIPELVFWVVAAFASPEAEIVELGADEVKHVHHNIDAYPEDEDYSTPLPFLNLISVSEDITTVQTKQLNYFVEDFHVIQFFKWFHLSQIQTNSHSQSRRSK